MLEVHYPSQILYVVYICVYVCTYKLCLKCATLFKYLYGCMYLMYVSIYGCIYYVDYAWSALPFSNIICNMLIDVSDFMYVSRYGCMCVYTI